MATTDPAATPPTPIWVCPVCKEPVDQHDRIAVSRHHGWHRLVEQQRGERHPEPRDRPPVQ